MPRIRYEDWTPNPPALDAIRKAAAICGRYARDGYDLTLRQLYYQFVARDLFPDERRWSWTGSKWVRNVNGTKNAEPNYKWLGEIINRARLSGLLDWNYIVDRTRALAGTSHWDTPGSIIDAAAASFRLDKWRTQRRRVEVWVEKEALAGVVGRVAAELDVDYFSCRGYVSQSEQWRAARRLFRYLAAGQAVTVLHLGDHDPSGIDMTRDIAARLRTFITQDWLDEHMTGVGTASVGEILKQIGDRVDDPDPLVIERIALNMDQIEQYAPPPNPTKMTDSRAGGYLDQYGTESWELDALDPDVLADLIRDHVAAVRDDDAYGRIERDESRHRDLLARVGRRWDDIVANLD
jgi:hypothetical protein